MRRNPGHEFRRLRTRPLLHVAAISILAVAGIGELVSAAHAAVPTSFVTRSGSDLKLDDKSYRFTGINVYNANNRSGCWYPMADGSILDDSLMAMGGGAQVIRAWFFQALATSTGARDWSGFDHTFAAAAARGIRVVVTLGNQWVDCDGPNVGAGVYKNKAWYQTGYKQTDPAGTVSYRDYVAQIVNRYKDDPTILAWQLMNEAESKDSLNGACSPDAGVALKTFAEDVSGLIKSIDPNHLVSLGTIGSGQCGAGSAAEYRDLHSISTIDLCEFHDYGSPLAPMPGDQYNGLQNRIEQCDALGKPLFIGEVGIDPATVGGFRGRADALAAKLAARRQAGVVGELVWAWNAFGSKPDTFDIGPGDPVLDVLSAGAVKQFVGQPGSPAVDSAFAAATADHVLQQIDFDSDGLVDGQPVTDQYAAQGVTFVGLEARQSASFSRSPPFGLQQQGYQTPSFTGNFSYVLSPPAASVGFFFNDDEAATDVTVTTVDGGVREFRIPRPAGAGGTTSTFYGYASPFDAIARIDFDPQEMGLQITDNMRIGSLPPVNDTTAPTVTVNTPWQDAVYTVGEIFHADFACADTGGSQLASCSGTVGNGQPIDTSTPGTKQFTVSATDGAGNPFTFVRSYMVVPVPDADGDGIDDRIDTGDGTFQDGGTTAGTIATIPAGYTVTVTDLPNPDGVRITVAGTGTDKVTITFTNPVSGAPCGTVKLLPGSDVELTCGSITVRVAAGSQPVEIVASDDTSLFVAAGEQATISFSTDGSFVVNAISGGDGKVTLVSNGVSALIDASTPRISLYDFVGFTAPVDNGGVLNVVKAGSSVPLKWRLVSEQGAPITNLGSASVASVQISCEPSALTDAVEQVASSGGGLQNLGDGYYQLNWKTAKNWRGCRVMHLSLAGEGPITHDALFSFK